MSAGTAVREITDGLTPNRRLGGVVVLVGAAIVLVPVAVGLPPQMLMLALLAVGLIAIAYARPPWAAYLLFAVTPLTAGISRGAYIPLLRPHEALGLLLGAGVALRALVQRQAGHRRSLRLTRIDMTILAMAGTSSLLPLLWMAARGLSPTVEDLLYASTIWKFYGLFLVVRASIRTDRQVVRCLQASLAAYAVVVVITVLQSLQLAGVPQLVDMIYATDAPTGAGAGRGTSTLGSSIAIGDVMAFHLAICVAWLLRGGRPRPLLAGMAALFMLGGLASGQFSGLIALGVTVFAIAIVTGHVRRLLFATAPVALIGVVALRPVVEERLADIDMSTGLPQSWTVRFDNLRLFVWPQVFSGQNWLFGVRPSARIMVDASWGPYIYIESGHTWLLWTGGIPFFVAFLVFTWVAVRTTAAIARSRHGPVGVVACASFASLLIVFLLMSFDPHITMRGTADLLFSLLALTTTVQGDRRTVDPLAPRADAPPSFVAGGSHADGNPIVFPLIPSPSALADPGSAPNARGRAGER
jgi:hypothetical protein